MPISWVAKPRMKYTFSRFMRWNKWHIHSKLWILFSLYIILSVTDICTKWRHTRSHITSYKWWRCIMCSVGQSWNHRSRSRKSENFSKSRQSYYHICPCDLTKKMNTYTLCFCPLIRKLQAFEIRKWAEGSQRKNRGHPISPVKYNLYFHGCEMQTFFIFSRLWNTAFLKYALHVYVINIFPVFHYCAFNKIVYLYWDISMPIQDITDTDVLLQVATPKQLLNNRSLIFQFNLMNQKRQAFGKTITFLCQRWDFKNNFNAMW